MDELREMKVTPDRYVTYRYAGASGDFNPIHLDDEFARSVELPRADPARPVDDGAGRARARRGGRRPAGAEVAVACSSAGMGVPEKEITVTSKLQVSQGDGEAVYDCEAVQDGNKLVRRGRAVLRI